MKKGLLKRILGLACMLIAANVIMAQGTTVPGYATTAYTGGGTDTTIVVAEGGTVPVYAVPDPYFHSSYTPTSPTLTAGFTWNWVAPAGLTLLQNDAQDNYNTITADAASAGGSPYAVSVAEVLPASYSASACVSPRTELEVIVVPVPSMAFETAGDVEDCEGGTFPSDINVTISDGYSNYRLVWNLEIKTVDDAGADVNTYDTDKSTAAALAESYTQAVPQAVASNASAHDILSIAGGFTCIEETGVKHTTVYTYTLVELNDQATRNGDFISLTGDASVPANFTYLAAAATKVVTVHPVPNTGPIYHIPTNWAN